MIKISPLESEEQIKSFYLSKNIKYESNCGCVIAQSGEEILGYCAYLLKDSITLNKIEPCDDIMLADGILRSALHVAEFNGITQAYYGDDAPADLFKKLDFISDYEKRMLNIEKLHESCCNCKKI